MAIERHCRVHNLQVYGDGDDGVVNVADRDECVHEDGCGLCYQRTRWYDVKSCDRSYAVYLISQCTRKRLRCY